MDRYCGQIHKNRTLSIAVIICSVRLLVIVNNIPSGLFYDTLEEINVDSKAEYSAYLAHAARN